MGQELSLGADIKPKKNRGYYPKPRPKVPKTPNETQIKNFNSIHFGSEINKCLKFLRTKSFWVHIFLNYFETS